ncbi:MAG: hypothetical protein ACRCX1_08840 [Bacteroidales bacterium]
MKNILVMALAVTTIFSSCMKQDDIMPIEETKTVKLNINAGILTKASENPLATDAKTTISSLYVYFLDAAKDEGNILIGSKAITGGDLTMIQGAGLEITGVSSSAKYVYVVANATENGITALPASGTLATIKAKTVTMGSINTGDWTKALLSNSDKAGNGSIGTVTDGKATATIEVMPDLARIEILSLTATQNPVTAPDYNLKSYDLNGVYLNGYFLAFHIGGAANGAAETLLTDGGVLNNVANWAKDVYGTPLTGNTVYTAANGGATGDVWAYMLPAGATPRIIFELGNVLYDDGNAGFQPAATTRYVTVKGFKSSGGTTSITTFERGKVYKVSAVNFTAKDTHETPNATDIDVTVTVTVLAWKGINVDPEL